MLDTTILDKVYRTFVEHEHKNLLKLEDRKPPFFKKKKKISLI